MANVSQVEEIAEKLAERVAESENAEKELNIEVVDVEFVKEGQDYFLRVYIDKPGGISIDDCEAFSRKMNELLDEDNFINEQYIFEVSSPGLTRPLKKDKDYQRSIGKYVDIRVYNPIDKQKLFTAVLKGYTPEVITIETDNDEIKIQRKNIASIRLAYVEEL